LDWHGQDVMQLTLDRQLGQRLPDSVVGRRAADANGLTMVT
jgi:hypothetical protein